MPPKEFNLDDLVKFYEDRINKIFNGKNKTVDAFNYLEKHFVENQPYNPALLFKNENDWYQQATKWAKKNEYKTREGENILVPQFTEQDHIEACREASIRFLSRNYNILETAENMQDNYKNISKCNDAIEKSTKDCINYKRRYETERSELEELKKELEECKKKSVSNLLIDLKEVGLFSIDCN